MLHRKKTFDLRNSTDDGNKTGKRGQFSVYKGLLLAMLSGFIYSAIAVLVKDIKNIDPGQLSVYRFLGIFVFNLPEAVRCKENLFGPRDMRCLLILRGIFCATNTFLSFHAFRYLPLGEAVVIIFSRPIFVTIVARVFLKEPCGIFQTVTVFVTVAGVILTTKIPLRFTEEPIVYTTESVLGILAAIGAMLFGTCEYVVTKKLMGVHLSVILFNIGWVSIAETAILTALVGNFKWHECGHQGLLIIALGALSYGGQSTLTAAMLCEMAGPVSTVRAAVDIVLAFLLQTFYFRDVPDLWSCTGALLVGFSIMFVALNKWVSQLPPDSTCREKLGWVLK